MKRLLKRLGELFVGKKKTKPITRLDSHTREGSYAVFDQPHYKHGWGTPNPIVIGYIWRSKKPKSGLVSSGIWDAVTGEFIFYEPEPKWDLLTPPLVKGL